MTRDELFNQDRGERPYYQNAKPEDSVKLPLTKDGFEALLERICGAYDLPVDDLVRAGLSGFFRQLERNEILVTIKELSNHAYRMASNHTTWMIYSQASAAIAEQQKSNESKENTIQ